MKLTKNKTILGSLLLSLLAVGVSATVTAAWFQVDQTTFDGGQIINAGSSEISTIGNVYGYKSVRQKNPSTGYLSTNLNVQRQLYTAVDSDSNEGSADEDTDLDVPTNGSGYYLIPEVSSSFKYSNSGTQKMIEYEGTNRCYYTGTFSGTKKFRFKKYSFGDSGGEVVTINKTIEIQSVKGSGATISRAANNIDVSITFPSSATYTIWVDHSKATAGVESSYNYATKNIASTYNSESVGDTGVLKSDEHINDSFTTKKATRGASPNSGRRYLYCTNNLKNNGDPWTNLYAYTTDGKLGSWPGTQMTFAYTNGSSEDIYYVEAYTSSTTIIFNNNKSGNWNQTVDITIQSSTDAFWISETVDGSNKRTLGGNWNVGDKTFYLINDYNGKKLFGDTPKAYLENGTIKPLGTFPGSSMTSGSNNTWSIKVPMLNNNYKLIFSNGTGGAYNQTVDITNAYSNVGKYYKITGTQNVNSTIMYTGSWQNSAPSAAGTSTKYTYYLYDYSDYFGGSAPYCTAYHNSVAYYTGTYFNGTQMAAEGTIPKLYKIQNISSDYNRLSFSNSTKSITVEGISAGSTYNGKTYVIHSNGTGGWYKDVTLDDEEDQVTYYLYDASGENYIGNSPKAYAYKSNPAGTSNTFYGSIGGFDTDHGAGYNVDFPGASMSAGVIDGNAIPGLFQITVDSHFDHIIFDNGSRSVQTDDASAAVEDGKPFFVLNGETIEEDDITKYCGSWQNSFAEITMTAEYFLKDGSTYTKLDTTNISNLNSSLGSGATVKGGTYTPAVPAIQHGYDSTNGIVYRFKPESTYWYTDNDYAIGHRFTPGTTTLSNASNTLYKRMYCDVSKMVTFYVDISEAGGSSGWTNIAITDTSNNTYISGTPSSSWCVGPQLYRITMPLNDDGTPKWEFKVGNGSGTYSSTATCYASSAFLHINNDRTPSMKATKSTNIGSATISVGGNSYTMGVGDVFTAGTSGVTKYMKASHNFFSYEKGIVIEQNDTMTISLSFATNHILQDSSLETISYGTLNWDNLTSDDQEKTFIEEGTSSVIKFKVAGRYTVYITKEGEISIASVPVLGNGFYIMPSVSSNTSGFASCTKMHTESDTAGYFNSWNATADDGDTVQKLYVRSYMNAVDMLSKTLVANSFKNSEATMTAGGIISLKPGKYNIRAQIESDTLKVYITGYAKDDFFSFDPLVSGKSIADNHTSILLEVEFKTTNTQQIYAGVDWTGLPSYLGVQFYASATRLTSTRTYEQVYTYMRTNYLSSLTGSGPLTYTGEALSANNDTTTYYA